MTDIIENAGQPENSAPAAGEKNLKIPQRKKSSP